MERLAGYHVDDADMTHYKAKFDMVRSLVPEADMKKKSSREFMAKLKEKHRKEKDISTVMNDARIYFDARLDRKMNEIEMMWGKEEKTPGEIKRRL